jgi:glutathione S-transferase
MRRGAGVPYPHAYASAESIAAADTPELKKKKYLFNCAQRAHQNYLENMPMLLTSMLIGGARHPRFATVCGIGWIAFRLRYWFGYMREDKTDGSGRLQGATFWAFQTTLLGLLVKTACDFIVA